MAEHYLVQAAYDSLGPWARADTTGELLAVVRAMLEPLMTIDEVARDTDTHEGWGTLLDVDNAPEWALPWLAQFVGVTPLAGLDGTSQRIRIRSTAGFHRGTVSAVVNAARQHLTGARRVEIYEREGSAWRFRLRTYASETPDPDRIRAEIAALKPAGTVFLYEVQQGIEIDALVGTINSQTLAIDEYTVVVPD